jgi:ABC-type dipeptide/oligopeptide/nickel transport system permease component
MASAVVSAPLADNGGGDTEVPDAVAGRHAPVWLGWLLRLAGVYLVASFAIFWAVEAMPEDPVSLRIKNPDPVRVAEIRLALGLDDPWLHRYGRYTQAFWSGEWGISLVSGRQVWDEVGQYLPATLELGLLAIGLGVVLGVGLTLTAGAMGWRWMERLFRLASAFGLTVPIYWIGLLLILLFSVALDWLPVGGRFDYLLAIPERVTGLLIIDALLAGDRVALAAALRHLALPVCTLALYPAAMVAGTLHARLAEPRLRFLVRALRARGLSPARIWGWHILRLASAPVVTVVGTQAGALLGGAVLTETVFSWPGMGRFLVDGVINRDVFVIQFVLLLVVLLALAVVTAADALAAWANPALRGKQGGEAARG